MKWTVYMTLGGFALASFAVYQTRGNDATVPAIQVSPRAEGYIQIDRCEIHDSMVNCTITNKLPDSQIGLDVGDIGVNLLSATYYDKKGREIGRTHLPAQKIPSGESVRDTIASYRPIGDIDTITIAWK